VSAAPALWEDAAYFASEGGYVYAVTAANRDPIWPLPGGVFKTGAGVFADLASTPTASTSPATDNKLYALNRNSGKIRWQYFGGAALRSAPAVTLGHGLPVRAGHGGRGDRQGVRGVQPQAALGSPPTRPSSSPPTSATPTSARATTGSWPRTRRPGSAKFSSVRHDFTVFGTNLVKEDGVVYAGTKQGRVVAVRPVLKPGDGGGSGDGGRLNPKHEARNPKQIQRTQIQSTKREHGAPRLVLSSSDFGFVSGFVLRISDFPPLHLPPPNHKLMPDPLAVVSFEREKKPHAALAAPVEVGAVVGVVDAVVAGAELVEGVGAEGVVAVVGTVAPGGRGRGRSRRRRRRRSRSSGRSARTAAAAGGRSA